MDLRKMICFITIFVMMAMNRIGKSINDHGLLHPDGAQALERFVQIT